MPRSIDIDFRWLISCRKSSLALALKLLGKQGATEDQYQRCRVKPTYSSSRSHLIRTVSSWMGPSVSHPQVLGDAAIRRKPGTATLFPAPFAGNRVTVPGFAPRAHA